MSEYELKPHGVYYCNKTNKLIMRSEIIHNSKSVGTADLDFGKVQETAGVLLAELVQCDSCGWKLMPNEIVSRRCPNCSSCVSCG